MSHWSAPVPCGLVVTSMTFGELRAAACQGRKVNAALKGSVSTRGRLCVQVLIWAPGQSGMSAIAGPPSDEVDSRINSRIKLWMRFHH